MAATQRKFDVPVLLPADPTTALQAATKQYVDAAPGAVDNNLLMNAAGGVNNRRFAGGSLSTGVYGYDRWKASASSTSVTITAGAWSLTGSVLQGYEIDPANPMAGKTLTFSVEDPSGTLTIQLVGTGGTNSGTISAASGRVGLSLVVPTTSGAAISLVIVATGTVTFKNPKLEIGAVVTPYAPRHITIEELLCQRYCPSWQSSSATAAIGFGQSASATQTTPMLAFRVRARVAPTSLVISSGSHFSVSLPSTANVTCTSVGFISASFTAGIVVTGGSTGLVAGNASLFFFNNASGWLYFEGCDF